MVAGRACSVLGAALEPHSMATHVKLQMQVRHVQGRRRSPLGQVQCGTKAFCLYPLV